MEKAMAPHFSTIAWKIPWTEEPGRLQSMGLLRVGHDWVTSLSLFAFMHWRRKWQPTPVFLPGESQDGGAWWSTVYGVTQSPTRLKWLSSSSSKRLTHTHHLIVYTSFLAFHWMACPCWWIRVCFLFVFFCHRKEYFSEYSYTHILVNVIKYY